MAHTTHRIRTALLAGAAMMALTFGAQAQEAKTYHFDQPTESLSEALNRVAQISHQELVLNADLVRGKNAPALKGDYTGEEAVGRLLEGTELSVRIGANGALIVEPVGSNAISPQADAIEPTMVVVTGTLLRGVAPTGTNVLKMTSGDIAKTGATNTNQILSKMPQVTSAFNSVPTLPTNDPGNAIIFPNLRNIPAGGATTLVLLNGHRTGASGGSAGVDPDIIPPMVLQQIDVVPDGGSSIYGSDAIGGVINLITRKKFDGFQISAKAGTGDGYSTSDLGLMAGKDWGSGSAYIAYTYATTGEIIGRERDYYHQFSANTGLCAPGTVAIDRGGAVTTYALPDRTSDTLSTCDNTDSFTIFPKLERKSLFMSLTQKLSDRVDVGITAFQTQRDSTSHIDFNDPNFGQTGTITSSNPYYVPIAPDTGTQQVRFSYANIFDNSRLNRLEQYGYTPTLDVRLGGTWKLRTLATYGHSQMTFDEPQIDQIAQTAALAGTTVETALNPYDLGTTNTAVLRSIYVRNLTIQQQSYQNVRAIVDGSLFTIPGGDVRMAMGVEFGREQMDNRSVGLFNARAKTTRDVNSAYAEFAVPVVSHDNAKPGIESLTLSFSGRYDDYSGVGGTFNPKVGINYEPVTWAKIRANWGKSFNAPPLGDAGAAADTRVVLIGGNPFYDPNNTTDPRLQVRPSAIIAGGNPDLKPQKSETWSIGADIKPPVWQGLTLSATYYNIKASNLIGITPIFTPAQAYRPVYSPWVIQNPTLAQAKAIFGNMTILNYPSVEAWYNSDPDGPAVILDARRQNFGLYRQDGIDFGVNYTTATNFGSFNAGLNGTYTLNREVSALPGDAFSNLLTSPGTSDLALTLSAGITAGNFSGNISLAHSAGYDLSPAIGTQHHVDAFDTVDLYLSYGLDRLSWGKDLTVTAYVGNLFDQDPPAYNAAPGYINGATVGRLIQFGIDKRF